MIILFAPVSVPPWLSHLTSAVLGAIVGAAVVGRETIKRQWHYALLRHRLRRLVARDRRTARLLL